MCKGKRGTRRRDPGGAITHNVQRPLQDETAAEIVRDRSFWRSHVPVAEDFLGAYVLSYSEPLLTELADVLNRPRIRDKCGLTPDDIETLVALVLLRGEGVVPTRRVTICRDPKDNMILEAAADGRADAIVS